MKMDEGAYVLLAVGVPILLVILVTALFQLL
jgi:hypothetical protein